MKEDIDFYDLLRYMLIIDPKERPSAAKLLDHKFFFVEGDTKGSQSKE